MGIPFIIAGCIILFILITNICIVPQSMEYVIERLGKYYTTWDAGLHMTFPIIDKKAKKITLKEQVLDTPPQPVITKDNVTMEIDAVVYYKVFDAQLFAYGAVNPVNALGNLSTTTLRNIIGELALDEALSSRDTINGHLTTTLDEATDKWGIKVTRVELKNIMPPKDIREAMQREMVAERTRRETVLEAEGHKQSVVTRAEGEKQAMILAAEGERDAKIAKAEGEAKATLLARQAEAEGLKALKDANIDAAVLELKKYEALIKLSDGRAAKIIVPTDVVDTANKNVLFSELTELGQHTTEAIAEPEPVKADPCCDKLHH